MTDKVHLVFLQMIREYILFLYSENMNMNMRIDNVESIYQSYS